jgi:hypothetical protein
MISFIIGITHDLSGRIQKMIDDLTDIADTTEIKTEFFEKTLQLLQKLNQDVTLFLASSNINFEEFLENNLSKFNKLNERFLAIELYRYHVIISYGENEKYFNSLIHRIYSEIQCDQSPPIVSGISNNDSYYWVYPTYDIIAVPFGEDKNLLNLPDLYHEIGHLIHGQYASFLKGSIDSSIRDFFQTEILNIDLENRDPKGKGILKDAFESWKESWTEEFICDLIATYLTGPSYAWTNLKIAAITSNSGTAEKGIYSTTSNHPSDESRMYAIFSMLRIMEFNEQIRLQVSEWQSFESISVNVRPPLYATILPHEIIDQLVANVYAACSNIGLLSYTQQIEAYKTPISKTLNDAWSKNSDSPETFVGWENGIIAQIRAEFQ